jgi:hypothetical protein
MHTNIILVLASMTLSAWLPLTANAESFPVDAALLQQLQTTIQQQQEQIKIQAEQIRLQSERLDALQLQIHALQPSAPKGAATVSAPATLQQQTPVTLPAEPPPLNPDTPARLGSRRAPVPRSSPLNPETGARFGSRRAPVPRSSLLNPDAAAPLRLFMRRLPGRRRARARPVGPRRAGRRR